MEERQMTCINCPMGCRMTVSIENNAVVSVRDNFCKRGEIYARQECIEPKRMLTAVAALQNRSRPISVKTEQPIPKHKIFACMRDIREGKFYAPIKIGDVLIENVRGTGVNIIATKNID